MMNFLGAMMVALGCAYIGWDKAREIKRKGEITGEFIRILDKIRREITEYHRSLPFMMKKIQAKEGSVSRKFFLSLERELLKKDERGFFEKWEDLLETSQEIPVELVELIKPLGAVLGQHTASCQGQALTAVLKELKDLQEKQEEEYGRLSQVYTTLGVSSGLFFVILCS